MKIVRNKITRITVISFLFFGFIGSHATGETVSHEKIIRDNNIIAPGIGAEGIVINEDIDTVLQRIGRNKFKFSKPRYPGELFKNVFKLNSKRKIYFESMYYHEDGKYTACVFHGKVIAIIGFNNDRTTTDLINLRNGINDFIYHYGNRNLYLFRSDSNGIYMYPDRGIAVVDDGMNDSIDLYLIFAIDK